MKEQLVFMQCASKWGLCGFGCNMNEPGILLWSTFCCIRSFYSHAYCKCVVDIDINNEDFEGFNVLFVCRGLLRGDCYFAILDIYQ